MYIIYWIITMTFAKCQKKNPDEFEMGHKENS